MYRTIAALISTPPKPWSIAAMSAFDDEDKDAMDDCLEILAETVSAQSYAHTKLLIMDVTHLRFEDEDGNIVPFQTIFPRIDQESLDQAYKAVGGTMLRPEVTRLLRNN